MGNLQHQIEENLRRLEFDKELTKIRNMVPAEAPRKPAEWAQVPSELDPFLAAVASVSAGPATGSAFRVSPDGQFLI
jgi:hypothetical protein